MLEVTLNASKFCLMSIHQPNIASMGQHFDSIWGQLEKGTLVWKTTEWCLSGGVRTFDLLALPVLIQILGGFFEASAEFYCSLDHMYHSFHKWLDLPQFTKYELFEAHI